jgi:hypothetical protein
MCVIVVALLVSFGGSSPAAQYDASPTDTELAQKLWRIAATSHVRVGFQSIGIPGHRRLSENIDPEPMAVSRALDAVVAADPRYEWHMVAGTAVIRPREAWTDPADPFNHRVPAVQITSEPLDRVLAGLSDLIFYNQFTLQPRFRGGPPVSFPMKAGTVIDALNQLAEQAGQIMWAAYARPRDNHDGWNVCQTPGSCHSVLQFDLRDAQYMSALLSTQPWTNEQRQRYVQATRFFAGPEGKEQ